MPTLYDLSAEALMLDSALTNEGFSDEERMSAMATYLAGAPVDKIEAYAKLIRTIEADSDVYKAEEQVFKAKRQTCENKITWLKAGLKAFFETTGCEFVKTPLFKVALERNGGVAPLIITGTVPSAYLKPGEPNNAAIREALEAGDSIDFAMIGERGASVRIR